MAQIDFSVDTQGEPKVQPSSLECSVNSTVKFKNSSADKTMRVSFDSGSPFEDFDLDPSRHHEVGVGGAPGHYGYAVNLITKDRRDSMLKSRTADIHVRP